MRQWGREAIDNGTMDVGTLETRTMGPWDNENGTVGHWRIAYWALGQCASGAMGREGHGRRDNAQQDNAMDHLPSMHECLSLLLPQLNWSRGPMDKAYGLRSRGLQARVLQQHGLTSMIHQSSRGMMLASVRHAELKTE
jgi:hypothetical protein